MRKKIHFLPYRFFKVWRDILNFSVERHQVHAGPDKLWNIITEYIRSLKKTQRVDSNSAREDRYFSYMSQVKDIIHSFSSVTDPLTGQDMEPE